jgi:hypothetical protein
MVDFKTQQEKILEFIEKNYIEYLPDRVNIFELTLDFLDFDKHKSNFTVFVNFSRIDFPNSDYEDDCEDVERLSVKVFLLHRNNTSEKLKEDNLDAAYAFYKMIKDKNDLMFVKEITIESIDFYNWVEGTKFLIVSEISLTLQI